MNPEQDELKETVSEVVLATALGNSRVPEDSPISKPRPQLLLQLQVQVNWD